MQRHGLFCEHCVSAAGLCSTSGASSVLSPLFDPLVYTVQPDPSVFPLTCTLCCCLYFSCLPAYFSRSFLPCDGFKTAQFVVKARRLVQYMRHWPPDCLAVAPFVGQ